MNRAAFCISIDVELGWGYWDMPWCKQYFQLCAEKEYAVVRRLLQLFARYQVSATWAIVGRLLEQDGPIPVPTTAGKGIWYAPDLVEIIHAGAPAQDIGSHTFEHIYFQQASREVIAADLRDARRLHEAHGLDFTSFVFPRNQVAHVDLLAQAGIRVFRGVDIAWHTAVREKVGHLPGRLAHLADNAIPVPATLVRPIVHEAGIVELPSSMVLMERLGLRKLIRPEITVAKVRLSLQAARRTGGIFHLWFHPSNFYHDTDVQMSLFDRILRIAAELRDRDQIDIRPMSSYAHA